MRSSLSLLRRNVQGCYIPRFPLNKTSIVIVDSWSLALDQIQMYPDRDTINSAILACVCFSAIVEEEV